MALTRPGKVVVSLLGLVVLVGGGLFVYTKVTGNSLPGIGRGPGDSPLPADCPLTGLQADVPDRPALVVKIENAPGSRPQAGMDKADIVYEQPAEGGITRFVAVYQCQDADRLGPIRSVRLVDPDLAIQFGPSQPLFAYSGGIPEISASIERAGLLDVGFDSVPSAYERDINRKPPHDLYSSTRDLYAAAGDPTGVPAQMFTYDPRVAQGARPATTIHVTDPEDNSDFSAEDIFWRWNEGQGRYLRSHEDSPHMLEGDVQVGAKNLIVQYVQTRSSGFTDINGIPVQEVQSVGQGEAVVFRNGQAVSGTWVRQFPEDVTRFLDDRERQIDLAAGNTWILLIPTTVPVTYE